MIQQTTPEAAASDAEMFEMRAISDADSIFTNVAHYILDECGVSNASDTVATLIMVAMSAAMAIAIYWVTKYLIFSVVKRLIARTPTDWDDVVLSDKVLGRIAFLPCIFSLVGFGAAMNTDNWVNTIYTKVVYIYMALCIGRFLLALLSSVFDLVSIKIPKMRSLGSIKQLLSYVVFVLVAIVIVSVVIGKSPLALLAGLGASAAIMSLVFKETIQSLVAGIQLSANNMVAVGDWIVVPKAQADGVVCEMTLNTVKVRNWDNTITTVSPSTLLSDSFTNWKGMNESAGRRIKRAIYIDMDTVRFLSPNEEQKFRAEEALKPYFVKRDAGDELCADGITNLTLFRQYLAQYLRQSPLVYNPEDANSIQLMVRYLEPTQFGLPVEIYCFSKTQEWSRYEQVIATITDHMIAVSERFGLQPYQVSSSSSIGWKAPEAI